MFKLFYYINLWFNVGRGYTLPMSILSWLIPFVYCLLYFDGSIFYGLLALFGIALLQWCVNLLDDIFDYWKAEKDIKNGKRDDFNFQPRKCFYIFNGSLTWTQALIGLCIALFVVLCVAAFFIFAFGEKLIPLLLITSVLCLLYPILDHFALGEIVIGIIFAPLIFCGVSLVMTGHIIPQLLLLSISSGLMTIGLSHTHIVLDFELDKKNSKKTLCTLLKTPENALKFQIGIIVLAYINIITCILFKQISPYTLLTLLSIPTAIELCRILKIHIKNPEEYIKPTIFMGFIENKKMIKENHLDSFMIKFITSRNLMVHFSLLLVIALILEKVF